MLNVVEAFSGIGSQAQALKNCGIEHNIEAILEWEVGALYSYDILHNGKQDLSKYRHHTKESLLEKMKQYSISNSGKEPITERALASMSILELKSILAAIERTNNLIDISQVNAKDFPENVDLLTYSFPCQDLSISGHWHNNTSGIDRDAENRSGLLWEVERILKDYVNTNKQVPKFLLMENVSNILSKMHIDNFHMWQGFLENLGYYNKVYTLNAKNFGIPQNRVRTYMISVYCENQREKDAVEAYFFNNNLENVQLDFDKKEPLSNFLKLDYSNEKYLSEAVESTPNFTPSRLKIYENNQHLAVDSVANDLTYARTITTKQDRNPNSGIIAFNENPLIPGAGYRNLTPRECFLLMGFSEEAFEQLMDNNFSVKKSSTFLPQAKLLKLAGNSIVVPVLEAIFKQVDFINKNIVGNKLVK